MTLLPTHSGLWKQYIQALTADQIRIWVPMTRRTHVREFVSTAQFWACLWDCGEIETFGPGDKPRRVIFMTPKEALDLHQKRPLVDLSLHEETLFFRFRRPGETPGTINATTALHRACGLPQPTRQTEAAA